MAPSLSIELRTALLYLDQEIGKKVDGAITADENEVALQKVNDRLAQLEKNGSRDSGLVEMSEPELAFLQLSKDDLLSLSRQLQPHQNSLLSYFRGIDVNEDGRPDRTLLSYRDPLILDLSRDPLILNLPRLIKWDTNGNGLVSLTEALVWYCSASDSNATLFTYSKSQVFLDCNGDRQPDVELLPFLLRSGE